MVYLNTGATGGTVITTLLEGAIMAEKSGNWFARHKVITVILVIVVLAIIGGAAGGDKKTPTKASNDTAAASQATDVPQQETPKAEKPAVPAEFKSALSQAGSYVNTMHMSKQGVYDQLVSEYGGKFSAVAAQYAIDNVKADWNAQALSKAKSYQDTMHLSPAAIHDQLTSENGEKFTAAEADYAIAHLND
jgi:hypothetical protein